MQTKEKAPAESVAAANHHMSAAPSSILYCTVCDSLLRTAVLLPCCQSPCCSACAGINAEGDGGDATATIHCKICNTPRPKILRHDAAVRKVADAVSTRCPNEGCEAIMRQEDVRAHRLGVCEWEKVACVFSDLGCTVSDARHAVRDHQTNSCVFRNVSCPQRCGLVLPARDVMKHVDNDCPKTLVPCPNKCAQDVQRGSLGEHDSVCPVRPRSCPYRPFGCKVHGAMTEVQLANHMAVSIHAHLLQLDNYLKKVGTASSFSSDSLLTPTSLALHPLKHYEGRFDWDASYVRNVGKWEAEPYSINALAMLGPRWVVSGSERGNLLVFDKDSGRIVKRVPSAGVAPVRSMLGTIDGRLLVSYGDCTVQSWMSAMSDEGDCDNADADSGAGDADGDGAQHEACGPRPLVARVNQQLIMPTHRRSTQGITHMCLVRLPRIMLRSKPSLLLVEGTNAKSLPLTIRSATAAAASTPVSPSKGSALHATSSPPPTCLGDAHCFEAVVCLLDDRIVILEESMLQLVLAVELFAKEEADAQMRKGRELLEASQPQAASAAESEKRRIGLCMSVIDGRWALVGCSDGSLRCVDLYQLQCIAQGSSPNLNASVSVVDGNVFCDLVTKGKSLLSDTAITAMAGMRFRREHCPPAACPSSTHKDTEDISSSGRAGSSSLMREALLAMGGSHGSIVVSPLVLNSATGEVYVAGRGGRPSSLSHTSSSSPQTKTAQHFIRVIPSAHKGPVKVITQVDGRHFASGGADECWRLWGPSSPITVPSESNAMCEEGGRADAEGPIGGVSEGNGKQSAKERARALAAAMASANGGGDDAIELLDAHDYECEADSLPLQVPAVDLPSSMHACIVSNHILYAAGGQGLIKEWAATTLRHASRGGESAESTKAK